MLLASPAFAVGLTGTTGKECVMKTDDLGITIEDHPYDVGYWARFNGQPKPTGTSKKAREQRKGWNTCDRELNPATAQDGDY